MHSFSYGVKGLDAMSRTTMTMMLLLLLLLASVVLQFIRGSAPGGCSCSSSLSILAAQSVEVVALSLFLVGQFQHNRTGY